MQQIGARTFRTVLIATALTTALAVPAFATPATHAGTTVTKQGVGSAKKMEKANKAKRSGDFDFNYNLSMGNSPNTARGFGNFDWTEQAVLHQRSKLIDSGKGSSLLIVKMTTRGNRQTTQRFVADNGTVDTDFQVSRNVVQIEVQVCKVRTRMRCANKLRLR
jgi:hypothetical protein